MPFVPLKVQPTRVPEEMLDTPADKQAGFATQLLSASGGENKEKQRQRAKEILSRTVGSLKETISERGGRIKELAAGAAGFRGPEGLINPQEAGLQAFGELVSGVEELFSETAIGAARTGLTEEQERSLTDKAYKLAQTPAGATALSALRKAVEVGEGFQQEFPRQAEQAKTLARLGSQVPLGGAALKGSAPLKKLAGTVDDLVLDNARLLTKGAKELAETGVETTGRLRGAVSGIAERININAEARRTAREAFEQMLPDEKDAVRLGLRPKDVQLIKSAVPEERESFRELLKAAQIFEAEGAARPEAVIGEPILSTVRSLDDELQKSFNRLTETIAPFGDQELVGVREKIIKRMAEKSGLRGVKLNERGSLDFSDTALSGAGRSAERQAVLSEFNDAVNRNALQAHRFRQELFEELGGKSRSGIKTTATADGAIQGIRQGLADALEEISPNYRAANEEVAKLIDLKDSLRSKFGEVSKGNEDLFSINAGILARRLTSNAKSGQELAMLLREVERELLERGVEVGVSITRLQEFMNLLTRHFDIAGDTSLLGILRTPSISDIPTGTTDAVMKAIGKVLEVAEPTEDTIREALRRLLQD